MKELWTLDNIKAGFERFKLENGRLPMAPEIDNLSYLPSSRQIQRKFGGLEKLRLALGYEDSHFGKGIFRKEITYRTNARGRDTELALEKVLKQKFGEAFVHTEKIFDDSKNRVDFYVYSPDGDFGIDVFYTDTMKDLQKNVNLKIDKYLKFPIQLFFVVGNADFKQENLDEYAGSKKKLLPKNIAIITLEKLSQFVENKKAYAQPF